MNPKAPESGRPAKPKVPATYAAQDVRQAEIVLSKSWQRVALVVGFMGVAVFALALALLAGT